MYTYTRTKSKENIYINCIKNEPVSIIVKYWVSCKQKIAIRIYKNMCQHYKQVSKASRSNIRIYT